VLRSPFVLRIGIEHLPPEAESPGDPEPRVEAQPRLAPPVAAPTARAERRREPDAAHRHTWALSASDLTAIDDPIARETLHFVQDLVEEDLNRSRREVTMPFLGVHDQDPAAGPLLDSELALLAAQEEWIQDRGPALMRRPLQQLLPPAIRRAGRTGVRRLALRQPAADRIPPPGARRAQPLRPRVGARARQRPG
jgi:hypothetical protein